MDSGFESAWAPGNCGKDGGDRGCDSGACEKDGRENDGGDSGCDSGGCEGDGCDGGSGAHEFVTRQDLLEAGCNTKQLALASRHVGLAVEPWNWEYLRCVADKYLTGDPGNSRQGSICSMKVVRVWRESKSSNVPTQEKTCWTPKAHLVVNKVEVVGGDPLKWFEWKLHQASPGLRGAGRW